MCKRRKKKIMREKNGKGGDTFPGWKRPQDERALGGFGMIIRAAEPGVNASKVPLAPVQFQGWLGSNPSAGSSAAPPGGSVEPCLLCL